jgi:uncharacterized Zn-finger protein
MSEHDGRPVAQCPHCAKKFDVSSVLGNERYDVDRDEPGQQVKCPNCAGVFTLPG